MLLAYLQIERELWVGGQADVMPPFRADVTACISHQRTSRDSLTCATSYHIDEVGHRCPCVGVQLCEGHHEPARFEGCGMCVPRLVEKR